MARHVACLAAAMLMLAIFRPGSALGSSAIVPDDFPTVQGAIDSGVDTVLVREGSYAETPVVNRQLALIGIGGCKRPRLNGLSLERADSPFTFSATGIAFAGPVAHHAVRRNMVFEFSECSLEGGFQSTAGPDADPEYISLLAFRNCRMAGDSRASADEIAMEADTVSNGGVSWGTDYLINIADCWFQGGPGSAITLSRDTRGNAARNVISNYQRGISGRVDTYLIEENRITNCDMGIDVVVGASTVRVRNNVIQDCRLGISVYAGGDVSNIDGNTVLRSGESGIFVNGRSIVESNVVAYSKNAGISLRSESRIRGNTVFKNGGPGLEILNLELCTIENNISFGNQWGLTVPMGAPVVLRCNDWFQNQLGRVSGTSQGSTDLNVDPMFCNVDSSDVRISSTSPLVDAPGCGQIGALGVGCGVTATLLQMLTVEPQGLGAVVRWRFNTADPLQSWLERATAEAGLWQRMTGKPRIDGEAYAQADEDVRPGLTYWYRVGWLEEGETKYSAPVSFVAEKTSGISSVLPNPSLGSVSIEWTLASAADIDIRVFDLAGREIASIAHGRFEAGDHSAHWDGRRSDGSPAPAGWYVARVGGRDMNTMHKFLLLR